jgi:hypothetical protein
MLSNDIFCNFSPLIVKFVLLLGEKNLESPMSNAEQGSEKAKLRHPEFLVHHFTFLSDFGLSGMEFSECFYALSIGRLGQAQSNRNSLP